MHNTYQLDGIEKNILTDPLTMSPRKPLVRNPLVPKRSLAVV